MSEIALSSYNDEPVVSSRQVAKDFERRHNDVANTIRHLINLDTKNIVTKFFHESSFEYRGRTFKEYLMNRDGFSLLVMGFTGEAAMEWKLKYIAAFNEMEKKLSQPKEMSRNELMARALIAAHEELEEKDNQIKELTYENKELKPKAEFADAITASDDAIPMAVFAKILCQNGILIDGRKPGQNILFENLRRTGYLCANKGKYWNTPQQCFVKMGFFKIDEGLNPFGNVRYTTRITPKGQNYFIRHFKRVMAGEEA